VANEAKCDVLIIKSEHHLAEALMVTKVEHYPVIRALPEIQKMSVHGPCLPSFLARQRKKRKPVPDGCRSNSMRRAIWQRE
jgi:hypothetical protein